MKLFVRLLLATVCAGLAGGATALIIDSRDLLFPADWHPPYGNFRAEPHEALRAAAFASLKRERPGHACVGYWLGRDDLYVYLTAGCAALSAEGARLRITGDQSLRPVRFRYDAEGMANPEWLDVRNYENSLRRLFPRAAADLARVRTGRAPYLKLLREEKASGSRR